MKFDPSLYLIIDRSLTRPSENIPALIRAAIDGGVTMIQLREKTSRVHEFVQYAEGILRITRQYRVPLIINDRVDIALAIDAEGVHLGDEDMPLIHARRLLGGNKIIGRSAHTGEEAENAEREGADYVGVGTIFPTESKAHIKGIIGVEGLKHVRSKITMPMVAIGGITMENVKSVMQTGVEGVAVISALMKAPDVYAAARQIRKIISDTKQS